MYLNTKIVLVSFALLMMAGCASIGPKRVHIDRGTYNNIVRETDQEQLLMNIVRQRYLEITQYIQVASLTASYSLSQSVVGSVSATTTAAAPTSWTSSLSPTVTYSDTPTISYVPLSSIEFAKSLMTPVSMSNFLLLAHAGGYDRSMLYSIFFEQIGDLDGDLLNQGGINHLTPEFIRLNQILDLMSHMYRKGYFGAPRPVTFNHKLGGLLHFKNHSENSPEARKLQTLLGIPPRSKDIIFIDHGLLDELEEKNGIVVVNQQKSKPRNVVYVKLRSVYAIIYFLGRGVQIPCRDINDHLTRELVNSDGSLYDWTNRMRPIFRVYSSEQEPREGTLVKVLVHNHWFYIKSSDQASKDTFDAVIRLLTLTSAVAASNNSMPILTIPVASAAK